MNPALGLQGQAALVTGSSRGWGRAVAFQLAREGVAVAVNGTKRESVDAVVEEIRALGRGRIAAQRNDGTKRRNAVTARLNYSLPT